MKSYHKIKNVYDRCRETGKLIMGEWATEELRELADQPIWQFTEKIDGMNCMIHVGDSGKWCGGRSGKSVVPEQLGEHLAELASRVVQRGHSTTIYGEGFGPKIQKGGGLYGDDQRFIAFDVRVNGHWVDQLLARVICDQAGIPFVKHVYSGNVPNAIAMVRNGDFESAFPGVNPEGLVARPRVELRDTYGNRIIHKIRRVDFENQ